MTKSLLTMALIWAAFFYFDAADHLDRSPSNRLNPACEIWSDAPGDEVCERCDRVAIESIELADGRVVRELACQGDAK